MTIQTAADIVGANAKVAISTTQGQFARRLWLAATGGTARFGDTNVSATRGTSLAASTVTQFAASEADITDRLDLTQAFLYVPTGTTVSVTWAT